MSNRPLHCLVVFAAFNAACSNETQLTDVAPARTAGLPPSPVESAASAVPTVAPPLDAATSTAGAAGPSLNALAPSSVAPSLSAVAPSASVTPVVAPPLQPLRAAELVARAKRTRRGLLVNVWASWCGSCRRELPLLVKLAPRLRAQGVELLLLTLDEPEARPKAHAMLGALGLAVTAFHAVDEIADYKLALDDEWPGMLPATFLFDRSGARRYAWHGTAYEEELVPVLERFMRGEPVQGRFQPALSAGKVVR